MIFGEIDMSKSESVLLLIFLVACIIITTPVLASTEETENTWTQKEPMHEARSGIGVAVVNNKVYVIGGTTFQGMWPAETGGIVGTNEEYDPTTDTWVFKKAMPTPRMDFAIAVYQNKIYCIGGITGISGNGLVFTEVNEIYDPATDTWENKTSLPTARDLPPGNVVNGKIYLIGGFPNKTLNEVYDPVTDTWVSNAPLPIAVGWPSGVFNNKIYFMGGYFDANNDARSITQIYDPNTDTWSKGTSPLTFFISGSAGTTTGILAPKRIYIFPKPYEDVEAMPSDYAIQVYDPETDSWMFGANLPTTRNDFGVAVVNDTMYIIGGYTLAYPTTQSRSTGGYVTKYAVNEQYTPFGYGKTAFSSPTSSNDVPIGTEPAFSVTLIIGTVLLVASVSVSLLVYFTKVKKKMLHRVS